MCASVVGVLDLVAQFPDIATARVARRYDEATLCFEVAPGQEVVHAVAGEIDV